MDRLGISTKDNVLVYDQNMFSAARAYFTFKVFGHKNISVLDGGLDAYVRDGGQLTDEIAAVGLMGKEQYICEMDAKRVVDYDALVASSIRISDPKRMLIIDARPAGRFAGTGKCI